MDGELGGAGFRFTTAGPGTDPLRANLGLHVGDDPALVHDRREALARVVGRSLVWMDQTHSVEVAVLDASSGVTVHRGGDARSGAARQDPTGCTGPSRFEGEWGTVAADGVVIDARGWHGAPGAAVMVADCLPVLLADTSGEVVAAVHAGRVGLVGGILSRAVSLMVPLVGGVDRLHALIGPSVCGHCYEVPTELREEVARVHPSARATTSWGTPSLDLPAAAEEELCGLGLAEVRRDGRCTREDSALHSHRRDPRCGRQAGVVLPSS
ncbi:MAG: polyphenol oxidase family protein [Pauljensenia sp.]